MHKKNRKQNNIFNSEFIFCSFVPVGLEDYINYFVSHFDQLTYLYLKFPHNTSNVYSGIDKYKKGIKLSSKNIFTMPSVINGVFYFIVLPLNYGIYLFQIIFFLFQRQSNKKRIFMGVNYFCTLGGILLKKLNCVDYVVYRVMDFFPLPPNGPYHYLNRIFYIIDQYCLSQCDYIWFTTQGHIVGREKYGYFHNLKDTYHIIPLGVNLAALKSKIDQSNISNIPKIIYCGNINKYHLLELMFQVINELKKKINNIEFHIVGSGQDEKYFRTLAQTMKLNNNIIFHGFLKEGKKLSAIMNSCLLGIALYKDEENIMKYTEPAKVKYYLSYGLPVIVSSVPQISKDVEINRVGFTVNNDLNIIVNIIDNYIHNTGIQKAYRSNVLKYLNTIDINILLDRAFYNTFKKMYEQ